MDCLSALDECFLRLETDAAHMHVGWTLLVHGEPPSLEELSDHVESRLELLPRFRRRVLTSRAHLHDPIWIDDDAFSISRHIRAAHAPAPGGRAGLRRLAGELLSTPLDRAHPLWRLYVVDGLGDGRFAIVGQAHHALTDGVAAVQMAQLLLEPTPNGTPRRERKAFTPVPAPPIARRALAAASERARLTRSIASLGLRTVANPAAVGEAVGEVRRLLGALATAGSSTPQAALNRPIGAARSVAFADLPLPVVRELGRRSNATVNDLVLTTAAIALGRYLRRIGESHPWLRVLVPVSTRGAAKQSVGNRVSAMFVELPVGERDPRAALAEVARQTRERKQAAHASALDALIRASRLVPVQLRDAAAWLATRSQTFNAAVATIPGPGDPLYLLGRRVQAAYPAVPLMKEHGLSIGCLSYCGSLHVGLFADPQLVPDVTQVARDIGAAFDALRGALDPRPPKRPVRPRPRSRRLRAAV